MAKPDTAAPPEDPSDEGFDPRSLPPYPPTDETGDVDLSLIDSNLRLAPAERVARHNAALELALLLRKAGERARGEREAPLPD